MTQPGLRGERPPIDARAPERVETLTFGVG
jgi:hypothetical protein